MISSLTIDIHAHMLPEETIRRLGKESPRVAPKLIQQPDGSTIMEIAGKVVQRPMPRECWDLDLRLADMDRHGVDMQAVCATVHTFFYDEERSLAAACAVLQNDEIAAVAKRRPDRFMALATLPMQDPQRAADELKRAMGVLGLRGAQIGSNVNGRNLDDPSLEPVWAMANELKAFILVHPHGEILPGDRSEILLHAQLRRPAVRDHDGRRRARLRRRHRAPSRHRVLPVPRRRLRAVSGRALRARLQCPRRAEDRA